MRKWDKEEKPHHWVECAWGFSSSENPNERLTLERAEQGLRHARRVYPAVRYHIKRYDDGEPDDARDVPDTAA